MTPFRPLAGLTAVVFLSGQTAPPPTAPDLSPDEIGQIEAALQTAPDQGFGPDAFGLARAKADLAAADPQRQAAGKSELAEAAIAYAAAEHGQRLAPGRFEPDWALRPEPYDARAEFAAALMDHRLAPWLAQLPPSDPAYQALIEAYRRYAAITAQGGWPSVPGKSRPGDSGPQVAALRARLAVEDPAVGTGPGYDDALKSAVARAEARFGLDQDGIAGPDLVAALDVSAEDRVKQIVANLERRRWMPRTPEPVRAEVNIADASLTFTEPGQPPLVMRVVVGQPKKRTPMMADRIKAAVLNPPWNVPPGIARKEIWPKIHRDPSYMRREAYVVKANGQLQQRAGPKSSLGAIKFDLDNPFGVYLHDTPEKAFFGKEKRDLSHGCIRLEEPNQLAVLLLKNDPRWSADAMQAAIATGKTITVRLTIQPAVYVAYWTVLPDPNGSVGFRADAYDWDQMLIDKLGGRQVHAEEAVSDAAP
jgi:murein L,D-transpeptidase YcbB/YkuD